MQLEGGNGKLFFANFFQMRRRQKRIFRKREREIERDRERERERERGEKMTFRAKFVK